MAQEIRIKIAEAEDLEVLVALVGAYHEFEDIHLEESLRRAAIEPLLSNPQLGHIWLAQNAEQTVGYIALCFGYSIEFGGRDAFVDEFFIEQAHRGLGIGRQVLDLAAVAARSLGVKALHLEVAKTNDRAARLYGVVGFLPRSKYQLMTREL